ncbi:hypothetical protein WDZ17_07895 [Pseudokineococcus basanitobsidens]|uniref:N-acetyltransferase domain-containing protein n=1 Tax=Pseudokineococcus basanitobsidens TaxID=1926649 RepID=A0ABU8RJH4_9ACTN
MAPDDLPAGLRTTTLAERPDLLAAQWALPTPWPTFMERDPVGERLFGRALERSPELQVLLLDADGAVLGRLVATPFAWSGADEDLPARGWDAVQERSEDDARAGTALTAVSLLEARLHPDHRGRGLSAHLLRAGRDVVRRCGFRDLVAPVRPTGTADPLLPLADHVARRRPDGLPEDPWLRVHVRAGARVVGVCPASMTVPGTLAQWRSWTGLPLDASGDVAVPGALAPLHVSVEHDHAVYVEPNVWVHHRLAAEEP